MATVSRVNVSLSADVLGAIDEFCSERGCSRSWLISTACLEYIEAQEKLPEVLSQLTKACDDLKKNVDDIRREKIAPV